MDLFIDHILSKDAPNCVKQIDEDNKYKNSILSCLNQWENFCSTFLTHPKCPAYITQDTLNKVHNTLNNIDKSLHDDNENYIEKSFAYEMWMFLYH